MKLAVLLASLAACSAFRTLPLTSRPMIRTPVTRIKSSTETEPPQVAPGPKKDLIDTISGSLSDSISASKRVIVNELLLKVEASNPSEDATTSSLFNGAWELVYSGGYSDGLLQSPTRQIALFLYAGGYTPGQFGLQLSRMLPDDLVSISDVDITISRDQPRAESKSTVQIANSKFEVKIQSTIEVESDVRVKETYTTVTVGDNKLDVPDALKYSRRLYVTYLDEDLMIVRDESGIPEILVRKSMEFLVESTGEPSFADDDLAPGAG